VLYYNGQRIYVFLYNTHMERYFDRMEQTLSRCEVEEQSDLVEETRHFPEREQRQLTLHGRLAPEVDKHQESPVDVVA
jgi:hypothetical protein